MLKEFKEFAFKGNVIDLAVGVIIGGAFGKIVSSLVADILMPLIGILMGGLSFSDLSIVVGTATLQYGLFIQTIMDFLIVALSIFFFVKLLNVSKKKKEAEAAPPPAPSKEELLLMEIRDLLKAQQD